MWESSYIAINEIMEKYSNEIVTMEMLSVSTQQKYVMCHVSVMQIITDS